MRESIISLPTPRARLELYQTVTQISITRRMTTNESWSNSMSQTERIGFCFSETPVSALSDPKVLSVPLSTTSLTSCGGIGAADMGGADMGGADIGGADIGGDGREGSWKSCSIDVVFIVFCF